MSHMKQVSKKRKFVADGVFYSELNEFLMRELAEEGYAGVEVRVTPIRTEIIIRATRTREVLGEKGRRIRELTSLVQHRFQFPENSVELFAEKVENRASCAMAQAESLRYKLLGGLAVRRACYGVLRFVMENGAKGCEVIVSGKLRAQRAKAMKFRDGYLISTGEPKNLYLAEATRHVLMRQGVLGIKVRIMLAHDPEGKMGPKTPMPDQITIHEPKEHVELPSHYVQEAEGYGYGGQNQQQDGGYYNNQQQGGYQQDTTQQQYQQQGYEAAAQAPAAAAAPAATQDQWGGQQDQSGW